MKQPCRAPITSRALAVGLSCLWGVACGGERGVSGPDTTNRAVYIDSTRSAFASLSSGDDSTYVYPICWTDAPVSNPKASSGGSSVIVGQLAACSITWSSTPQNYHDTAQTQTVTMTLSKGLKQLRFRGVGAYDCRGTFGTVTAFNSAGTALVTKDLEIHFPEDCGIDELTGWVIADLVSTQEMVRFEVTVPNPTSWMLPPPWDQVAYLTAIYHVEFVEPCPPTGDNRLDSPEIRAALRDALLKSRPDSTPGTGKKKERGGIIWQRQDGTFFATLVDPPSAVLTECSYRMLVVPGPPELGASGVASYHTHPSATNEDTYECQTPPGSPPLAQTLGDGKLVPKALPNSNGGGSVTDWRSATVQGIDAFVINKDGFVWKLDSNTPQPQWANNTNKWDWKNAAILGCFIP